MLYIRSLEDLKKWNQEPTTEKPVVLEWFLLWFFESLLMYNKFEEALDAAHTIVKFTEVCENMTQPQAIDRCLSNFIYFSGYGPAKWGENFSIFRKKYWVV